MCCSTRSREINDVASTHDASDDASQALRLAPPLRVPCQQESCCCSQGRCIALSLGMAEHDVLPHRHTAHPKYS